MRARRRRRRDSTGTVGTDFDELDVYLPGERAQNQRRKRARLRRDKFHRLLGESGLLGLAMMGVWRLGDVGRPGTLGGDLAAAMRAKSRKERDQALTALARHPRLVSTFVAQPDVRRVVASLNTTAMSRRVREVVFPLVPLWALRLAWDEVAAAARIDDRLQHAHAFAQRLHERAMAEVAQLLKVIAEDAEQLARAIDAPAKLLGRRRLTPVQQESLLVAALAPALPRAFGSAWRRRLRTMLGCTPDTLAKRRSRLNAMFARTRDMLPKRRRR